VATVEQQLNYKEEMKKNSEEINKEEEQSFQVRTCRVNKAEK
jgi:hypothetical protein